MSTKATNPEVSVVTSTVEPENNVFDVKFVRERDITYKDKDTSEARSFSVVSVRFTDKVVKTMTKMGEEILTDTIDFERSYWYARLREIPAIQMYLDDERPFVSHDKFFANISIELNQTIHYAGDLIGETNKVFKNSGYSTDIVRFKLNDIAKLQLKYYILMAAFMDDAAQEIESKLKAALAVDAKSALAALDAL